jgi:hypothetical protein
MTHHRGEVWQRRPIVPLLCQSTEKLAPTKPAIDREVRRDWQAAGSCALVEIGTDIDYQAQSGSGGGMNRGKRPD